MKKLKIWWKLRGDSVNAIIVTPLSGQKAWSWMVMGPTVDGRISGLNARGIEETRSKAIWAAREAVYDYLYPNG